MYNKIPSVHPWLNKHSPPAFETFEIKAKDTSSADPTNRLIQLPQLVLRISRFSEHSGAKQWSVVCACQCKVVQLCCFQKLGVWWNPYTTPITMRWIERGYNHFSAFPLPTQTSTGIFFFFYNLTFRRVLALYFTVAGCSRPNTLAQFGANNAAIAPLTLR